MPSPGSYTHTDGAQLGPPPPGVPASDWAIHEANVQKYGPLPQPLSYKYSIAAGRRIASYPPGTFPIKSDESHHPGPA